MTAQFDDGKEDGALRTIGEVSRATGIKTHVLRYWEQNFPMLEPLKRSGGRRYYRSADVQLIETIDRLVNKEGYTLKGAQHVIEGGDTQQAMNSDATGAYTPDAVGLDADGASDAAAAATPAAPLPFDPASDGGLDNFFGRQDAEADVEPEINDDAQIAAGSQAEADPDPRMTRAEIVARLKSLRSELAEALAA